MRRRMPALAACRDSSVSLSLMIVVGLFRWMDGPHTQHVIVKRTLLMLPLPFDSGVCCAAGFSMSMTLMAM